MTTTATRPITGNDRLTALKHLANGRDPDFVAAALTLDADDVVRIGEEYGWPDPERLRWSIDELQRQARAAERAALSTRTTVTPTRPATPVTPRVHTTTPHPPAVDSLTGLLHRADQLDDGPGTAAVRRAAKKVRDAGMALEHALNDVETKHRKARAEAERKAKLRADVERLERQLAEKKAQLRGTTSKTSKPTGQDGGSDAKAIRAWAAANGINCPGFGRIPKAVREQYDARQDAS